MSKPQPSRRRKAAKSRPSGPWKIVQELEENRQIHGAVLHVGCGKGEDTLYLARRGYEVWGIDTTPAAIRAAQTSARRRKLLVPFLVADPLHLEQLRRRFDTVVDSGVFASRGDEDRRLYARSLARALDPCGNVFLLGNHGQGRAKVKSVFRHGWRIHPLRTHPKGAGGWAVALSLVGAPDYAEQAASLGGPGSSPAAVATDAADAATGGLQHIEIAPDHIAAAQKCPNWCWAASLQMLSKSQGIDISQEWFVRRIYGTLPDGEPPCLPSGTLETIRQAIQGVWEIVAGVRVALAGAYHLGVPTNNPAMIRSIEGQRPFIFGFDGHAFVCYGLTYLDQGPTYPIQELNLIDPLWELMPETHPELTTFDCSRYDLYPYINGTFELLVQRQPAG